MRPGPDEAMAVMRERLPGNPYHECTRWKGRQAFFFVAEDQRKIWSPHLSIEVEPGQRGSLLRGRFGPHPHVWTVFLVLYAAVGFLTVLGLFVGFIQWQAGTVPWGLWGVWLGVSGLVVLYGLSILGQMMGAHQTAELKRRVEDLVEGLEWRPSKEAADTALPGRTDGTTPPAGIRR
jgi:hypothetical protein